MLDARKQKVHCFKDVTENYFHPKMFYLANNERLKHESIFEKLVTTNLLLEEILQDTWNKKEKEKDDTGVKKR